MQEGSNIQQICREFEYGVLTWGVIVSLRSFLSQSQQGQTCRESVTSSHTLTLPLIYSSNQQRIFVINQNIFSVTETRMARSPLIRMSAPGIDHLAQGRVMRSGHRGQLRSKSRRLSVGADYKTFVRSRNVI